MRNRVRNVFWTLLAGLVAIAGATNAAAQIQVTSANPNNTAQGTVNLNVIVTGNGFKKGAIAKWFVSGTTNPGGVTVNSTAFNSSGQLTANISVAADAVTGGFDIVVTNADGRSGKGTELFSVNSNSASKQGSVCPAITPINPPIYSPTTAMCSNSGCTDATFGTNGFVITNTDGSISPTVDMDSAASVQQVVMPDSSTRILAIGVTTDHTSAGYGRGIALVRYNNDGSLDTAFGNGGIVTTFVQAGSVTPMDGVLDSQGNIVVLSEISSGALVTRFHSDGTLDTSFNGTGTSPLLSYLFPQALALDPAGNILAAGQYTPVSKGKAAYGAVFRVTSSGAIDSSFGSAGVATNTSFTSVGALAIETVNSTPYVLFASGSQIARLTPSGAPDSTFAGGTGLAGTNACGYGYTIRALRIDTSGNILATGYGSLVSGGSYKIIASRFTTAGNLDSSFGLNSASGSGKTGFTVFDLFGAYNYSDTAAVFSDGSGDFAVAGYANTSGTTSYNYVFVVKVDSTGNLVSGFNNSNVAVALDWGSGKNETASLSSHSLLIEPSDGKLIVGGTTDFSSGPYTGYNFAIARIWP